MKIGYTILFVCLICVHGVTQELVMDGSFEDTIECPSSLNNFNLSHWRKPNGSSSDLFCSCYSPDMSMVLEYKKAELEDCFIGLLLHNPPSGFNDPGSMRCHGYQLS
jgi:hypothetical protein